MSTFLSFIIIVFTILEANAASIQPRVAEIYAARENEFPYQAFVFINERYACGAVLISYSHLLTAANCVESVVRTRPISSTVEVKLGSMELSQCTSYPVLRISIHPEFEKDTERYHHVNDVSVIHLLYAALSTGVKPIQVPILSSKFPVHNSFGIISGITNDEENEFLSTMVSKVMARTERHSDCQKILFPNYILSTSQICTITELENEPYTMDIGNPMTDTNKSVLFGVLSAVRHIPAKNRKVIFFTKIAQHMDYIDTDIRYFSHKSLIHNPPPAINFAWSTLPLFHK